MRWYPTLNRPFCLSKMELVFVGHQAFLGTIATLLPRAARDSGPVESLERDDTAFVCPMYPDGLHVASVYDSKAMFRGSQVNMRNTIHRFGFVAEEDEPRLPMGSALGVSVWGSSWLIGSVEGDFARRDRGSVAYDAFFAAYTVANSLPGGKRLVCPPLGVGSGRLGFRPAAAQIANAYKDVLKMPEQKAVATADARGIDCYIAMF